MIFEISSNSLSRGDDVWSSDGIVFDRNDLHVDVRIIRVRHLLLDCYNCLSRATEYGGISQVTIDPAPIVEPFPMVIPGRIITFRILSNEWPNDAHTSQRRWKTQTLSNRLSEWQEQVIIQS